MSDSIQTHYGGSVFAMKGNNAVALISDNRLGNFHLTVHKNFNRVYKLNNTTYIGLCTFLPDAQILLKKIIKNVNLFELTENYPMQPCEISSLVSRILYNNRFKPYYTSPIIAGVGDDGPFISVMDCIGCISEDDYAATGNAEHQLLGMAESMYKPNMNKQDLIDTVSVIFNSSANRDPLSGWSVKCLYITNNSVVERTVKSRID